MEFGFNTSVYQNSLSVPLFKQLYICVYTIQQMVKLNKKILHVLIVSYKMWNAIHSASINETVTKCVFVIR